MDADRDRGSDKDRDRRGRTQCKTAIEQTKKVEASYVNSLNTNRTFLNEFDLKKEQVKLEKIFREPNLLVTTIKQIQSEQEENISQIKWRLNKMNESKCLVKSNSFFQIQSRNELVFRLVLPIIR